MRTFVLYYCLSLIAISVHLNSIAQNHVWTLPTNYYQDDNIIPLPIPPDGFPGDDYEGQPALHAHNAIAKPNGQLVFFVVDDKLYDKDGYLMYAFRDANGNSVSGNGEVCLVPVPGTCAEQFYVFLSNSGSDGPFRYPFASLLDLELPSILKPGKLGAPVVGDYDFNNTHRLDQLVDFEDEYGNPIGFNSMTHEGLNRRNVINI